MAGIIILVGLFIIWYLWQRSKSGGGKEKALRKECRRLLKQPPESADQTIERYLVNLRGKHPGQSEEWYLEKIIYDLERDR